MLTKQKQIIGNSSIGIQANELNLKVNIENQFKNSDIEKILTSLAGKIAINSKIKLEPEWPIQPLNLDPPILIKKAAKRNRTVQELIDAIKTNCYLHIFGEVGIGKTTLGLLIIENFGGNHLWLPFKEIEQKLYDFYFNRAFTKFFNKEIPYINVNEYFDEVLLKLPEDSIIILDDLPKLSENYQLAQKLIKLIESCKRCKINLITISFFELPENFKNSIGKNCYAHYYCPPFNLLEIKEIAQLYKAPPNYINDTFMNFIGGWTNNNPILLNAIFNYLENNNWAIDYNLLNGLLNNKYAQSDKFEYYSIFSNTTQQDIKELIYRLDLITNSFSDKELLIVSSVSPEIHHPSEKLNSIENIWIKKNDDRYYLSPLIKGFGKTNLAPNTIRTIYSNLGNHKLALKCLNQQDILEAIAYFLGANEYNQVATILIKFYSEFIKVKDRKVEDFGISEIWLNMTLPDEMDLNLRLLIRAYQLKVNERKDANNNFLFDDLNILFLQANEKHGLGLITVTLMLANLQKKRDISLFYKFFIKGLSFKKEFDSIYHAFKLPFESLLLLVFEDIKTSENLFEWFKVVEQMPNDSIKILFECEIAAEVSMGLVDSVWLIEAGKNPEDQDWQEVIEQYNILENRTVAANLEFLWACIIRAKIVVFDSYINKPDEAIRIGKNAIERAPKNPLIQYVIKEIIARQCLFSERYTEADFWFKAALEEKFESLFFQRAYALLLHSKAVSNIDLKRANDICKEGVNFAYTHMQKVSTNMLSIAYGEYALHLFKRYDVYHAFEPFEKGIELLFTYKSDDRFWKELFVIYGHISGYFTSVAGTGKPPLKTKEGLDYLIPEIGMLLNRHEEISNYYNPSMEIIVSSQVSLYAEAIARDENARKWGNIAYNLISKNENYKEISLIINKIVIPELIIKNKFIDSIILGYKSFFMMKDIVQDNNINYQTENFIEPAIYYNCLIPIIIRIGYLKSIKAISDEDIYIIMENISNSCLFSNKDGHQTLKSFYLFFKDFFSENLTPEQFVNKLNNIIQEGKNYQAIYCALLASLKKEMKLELMIQSHLAILGEIYKTYSKNYPYIYRQIIIPYFIKFWTLTFMQNKFRFITPGLVETNLNIAINTDNNRILLNILNAVSAGLNIKIPENIKKYFI